MQISTWRFIKTPPMSGAFNMAVDEALLENIATENELPVFRLYDWNPPCLSLGFSQPITDVNIPQIEKLSWGLVRRPTGGRAVLHTDELTYSIIAPLKEERVKGSIIESYRRLSTALVAALNSLSLNANADKAYDLPAGTNKQAPVCFEVPSNYEITINGKKLIGSAQARKHKGVLQHGSLPLHGDLTRIIAGLNFPNEVERQKAKERLLLHATTTQTATNRIISWEEAANAFLIAFQKTLNINFVQSSLSEKELNRAKQLELEKYNHKDWLYRK